MSRNELTKVNPGVNLLNVTTRLITQGAAFSIHAIMEGGRSHFEQFFAGLPTRTKGKLRALFDFIAKNGAPRNPEKFRHEEDEIFAIKQNQIRVYCFFDAGRMIVVTHGTLKKRQKANPEDLKRAKRLREEYLKAKRP
jgi:hypothetical protein